MPLFSPRFGAIRDPGWDRASIPELDTRNPKPLLRHALPMLYTVWTVSGQGRRQGLRAFDLVASAKSDNILLPSGEVNPKPQTLNPKPVKLVKAMSMKLPGFQREHLNSSSAARLCRNAPKDVLKDGLRYSILPTSPFS